MGNRSSVTETSSSLELRPAASWDRAVAALRPYGVPLAAFAASRIVTFLAISLAAFAARKPFDRILTAWDGRWYEKIALGGYPTSVPHGNFAAGTGRRAQSEVAFFPFYPMLVRIFDPVLPGSAATAGVVVTLLCGAAATVLVWMVADRVADRPTADRASILFSFFPGAFVMSLVYAEALMVALGAACLLALMDRRWVWAGLFAALATATRPNASAVAAACAWAALVAIRRRREWRAMVAPLLAPGGMLAFFAFLWWHTGEPLVWFRVQAQGWGEDVDFGHTNLATAWAFIQAPLADPNRLVLGLSLMFTIGAVAVMLRSRLPGILNVYALTCVGLVLTSHINARPRFLFVAFPLVIALAKWAKRPTVFAVLAGSFAAAMTMLTIFYGLHRSSFYP